ncbi:E3 ubiquitin-protein ligase TRIM45-like [Amphiura filiformis]|uniref:E3 ubiquitin-protein ligase TRIM45-like n=1 Tax=Amphiura filiformis TaxID=82378 RepID=UPI003B20C89D
MADSKPSNTEEPPKPTLLHCGICSAIVDKLKVLPCLHAFCLKCLLNWSETAAEKDPSKYTKTISCPTCHEDSPLPEGGVKELMTIVPVGNVKEQESVQKTENENDHITCSSCDGDNEAVGRCADCGEFLCESCSESHKRLRKFKSHDVTLLGDLSADSLTFTKANMCPKHAGKVLKLYCETCAEPACQHCVVTEHVFSNHILVDLNTVLQKRKTYLETLHQQSKDIPEAVDAIISEDDKLIIELDANVEDAIDRYKKTAELAEADFMKDIQQLQASRRLEIESHKQTVQNQKSRVCAALDMSREVTQVGTGNDFSQLYATLSKAIVSSDDLKPNSLRKSITGVDFLPNKDPISDLGILSGYKQWKLIKTIKSESWEYKNPKSIAYCKSGDIMVAVNYAPNSNLKKDGDVALLDHDGHIKRNLSTKVPRPSFERTRQDLPYYFSKLKANPWGVAIGRNGLVYVTDQSKFIEVFNENGDRQSKLEISCDIGAHTFRGLASDSKGLLFVGNKSGYITTMFEEGRESLRFSTNESISPEFIAVTSEGYIIYSGTKVTGGQESSRVILHKHKTTETSHSGREHALPPPAIDVANFRPTGICAHEGHQAIFVANAGEAPGVYCYSLTGDYVGIVTKEVTSPQGIALSGDEHELAVCDGNGIKLFHPQFVK